MLSYFCLRRTTEALRSFRPPLCTSEVKVGGQGQRRESVGEQTKWLSEYAGVRSSSHELARDRELGPAGEGPTTEGG
jgi:hypothetical protein